MTINRHYISDCYKKKLKFYDYKQKLYSVIVRTYVMIINRYYNKLQLKKLYLYIIFIKVRVCLCVWCCVVCSVVWHGMEWCSVVQYIVLFFF